MAPWGQLSAGKSDKPSLIPGSHTRKKTTAPGKLSLDLKLQVCHEKKNCLLTHLLLFEIVAEPLMNSTTFYEVEGFLWAALVILKLAL